MNESKQLNILIGPSVPFLKEDIESKETFIGQLYNRGAIKFFSDNSGSVSHQDLTYTLPNDNFTSLLEQLPTNWEPDVVIWFDIVRMAGLIPGIENCPYPLIGVISDWVMNIPNAMQYIQLFDYILSDQMFISLLKQQGIQSCSYSFAMSFYPNVHQQLETERIYDLTFIGTVNSVVRPERSRYLKRLSILSSRYQLLFTDNAYGQEYVKLLNQSKIVFNYSEFHTMNPRVYESSACGALLFIEEDNLDIAHYFKDREHCIYYNEENLEELIDYYLTHEDERQLIASNGCKRIQSFTYDQQFEDLYHRLPTLLQKLSPQRKLQHLPPLQQKLILSRNLSSTFSPGAFAYIDQLFSTSDKQDMKSLLELGTSLMERFSRYKFNYLYLADTLTDFASQLCSQSLDYYKSAQELSPEHPMPHLGQAIVYTYRNEWELARVEYQKCLKKLEHFELNNFLNIGHLVYPIPMKSEIPMLTYYLHYEIQRLWVYSKQQLRDIQQLLKWNCWHQIGQLALKSEDFLSAYNAFKEAQDVYNYAGINEYWTGYTLLRLKRFENSLAELSKALNDIPLDDRLMPLLAELPIEFFDFANLYKLYESCLPLLKVTTRYHDLLSLFQTKRDLCLTAMVLSNKKPLSSLESIQFSPMFSNGLQSFVNLFPNHPLLKKLNQALNIYWDHELIEPPPELEENHHFILTPTPAQADINISQQKSVQANHYQRSYSEQSDLGARIIGLDLLPLSFPTHPIIPFDYEDLNEFNYLFLCDELDSPELIKGVQTLTHYFKDNSSVSCLLWKPFQAVNEKELAIFSEALDIDTEVTLSLLTDTLSHHEIASLLNSVDIIIGSASHSYFLAWSSMLLKKACYCFESTLNIPELSKEQNKLFQIDNWQDFYPKTYLKKEPDFLPIQKKSHKNCHDFFQLLWNIKLFQVLSRED